MKQFNKDIYLIDPHVLENLLKQPPINPQLFLEGVKSQSIKGSILITIEELRIMWRLAMQHGVRPYDTVSFEDFLTSKRIKHD